MATINVINSSLSGQSGTGNAAGTIAPSFTNPCANTFIPGYTTTVTSASPITLTATSTQYQFLTDGNNQTVVMPVASTLTAGHNFHFIYNSYANITFQSSGGNTIGVLNASGYANLVCILASGTDENSWSFTSGQRFLGPQDNVTFGVLGASFGIFNSGYLRNSFTSVVTAGGSTDISSSYYNNFTGTLNQTAKMLSVVSYGATGITYEILNNSSGTITVNSNDNSLIVSLAAGKRVKLFNVSTAVDTAAAWNYFTSTINA